MTVPPLITPIGQVAGDRPAPSLAGYDQLVGRQRLIGTGS
jgi:hypothetical protein